MENKEKEPFSFTYSAKEQDEIKKIRMKYSSPFDDTPRDKEDKMIKLRRLDQSVSSKATAYALIFGIIGTLILGLGMSLAMSDLADILGTYSHLGMLIGIIIGVIGIVLVCIAYPIYNYIIKKERRKIAPEIIRLTDELMK